MRRRAVSSCSGSLAKAANAALADGGNATRTSSGPMAHVLVRCGACWHDCGSRTARQSGLRQGHARAQRAFHPDAPAPCESVMQVGRNGRHGPCSRCAVLVPDRIGRTSILRCPARARSLRTGVIGSAHRSPRVRRTPSRLVAAASRTVYCTKALRPDLACRGLGHRAATGTGWPRGPACSRRTCLHRCQDTNSARPRSVNRT